MNGPEVSKSSPSSCTKTEWVSYLLLGVGGFLLVTSEPRLLTGGRGSCLSIPFVLFLTLTPIFLVWVLVEYFEGSSLWGNTGSCFKLILLTADSCVLEGCSLLTMPCENVSCFCSFTFLKCDSIGGRSSGFFCPFLVASIALLCAKNSLTVPPLLLPWFKLFSCWTTRNLLIFSSLSSWSFLL